MRSNSPCWEVFNYTRDRIFKPFKEPRNRFLAWRAGMATLFDVPSCQCWNFRVRVYRSRVRIGLSYRPARLHRLAELVPWNRFLSFQKVKKYHLRLQRLAESIPWNLFLSSLNLYKFGLWILLENMNTDKVGYLFSWKVGFTGGRKGDSSDEKAYFHPAYTPSLKILVRCCIFSRRVQSWTNEL